jgi:hypothetical protein
MTRLTAFILSILFCCATASAQPDAVSFRPDKIFSDSSIEFASYNAYASSSTFTSTLKDILSRKRPVQSVLGHTSGNRPIEVFYFPGTSDQKALIVGGMHGSELSSIEIAGKIVKELSKGGMSYYNVIIIPCLFPDNAASAAKAGGSRMETNQGRYSHDDAVDPNRQMPALGMTFNNAIPVDGKERLIEKENQLLLELIQTYSPSRIVNLHAIKDISKAGIYADPRTDCNGVALGFETDSLLAVKMASFIRKSGGIIPGNKLSDDPTALYYTDPHIAGVGSLQKRNTEGSKLPNERGSGISLGSWASTAVCNGNAEFFRPAIRLITVEFPGYKKSAEYKTTAEQKKWSRQTNLYAAAILNYFLENYFVENTEENPVASK